MAGSGIVRAWPRAPSKEGVAAPAAPCLAFVDLELQRIEAVDWRLRILDICCVLRRTSSRFLL